MRMSSWQQQEAGILVSTTQARSMKACVRLRICTARRMKHGVSFLVSLEPDDSPTPYAVAREY